MPTEEVVGMVWVDLIVKEVTHCKRQAKGRELWGKNNKTTNLNHPPKAFQNKN